MPWVHPPDAVKSFALFLQHSKKKVEGDKNSVEANQEVEEEDKKHDEEKDDEDDSCSELSLFEVMSGNF